ncbi:MAG: hypothetical protein JWP48_5020, partial [Actinoallomurus sp.]|nr:hypothetical protein [Actinoallomurus sp.]
GGQVQRGPAALIDLIEATRLVGLSRVERASELEMMSSAERESLASDPVFAALLRRSLSAPDFAATAAQLMIQVRPGVERPVLARQMLHGQLTAMMQIPEVAARLLARRRVILAPRTEKLTSIDPMGDYAGQRTHAGSYWDDVRAVTVQRVCIIDEGNLSGELGSVDHDGQSSATHEYAHAVWVDVLTPSERRQVKDVFDANWAMEERGIPAPWPNGLLRNPDRPGGKVNYSASNVEEFFAELSATWMGTNRGSDYFTKLPRNNWPKWVKDNLPTLAPLLTRFYGPNPLIETPVNPTNATQAVNDAYYAFRRLWERAEAQAESSVDHATRIMALPPADRSWELIEDIMRDGPSVLREMSTAQREILATDPVFVTDLRLTAGPGRFVHLAANLMIEVPERVDEPAPAQQRLHEILSRLLRDPLVAETMLLSGHRMFVTPRNHSLTSLEPWHPPAAGPRQRDEQRSVTTGTNTAIAEEYLLGGTTSVGHHGPVAQPSGSFTAMYVLARAIYRHGSSDGDRRLIRTAFQHGMASADQHLQSPYGRVQDPAQRGAINPTPEEVERFFAEAAMTWLGMNARTDSSTALPHSDGATWVRANVPSLVPLLERIYGKNPEATRLVLMSPDDRVTDIRRMSQERREALGSDPLLVSELQRSLSADQFAATAAELMPEKGQVFELEGTPVESMPWWPGSPVDEATRLLGLSSDERVAELAFMSPARRESLASSRSFVAELRHSLSPSEFAAVAGRLITLVPVEVERPILARDRLHATLTVMLHDPEVAEWLLSNGFRVIIVPRTAKLTSLPPWGHLSGQVNPHLGWHYDDVRAVSDLSSRRVAVPEENLVGHISAAGQRTPSGYSDAVEQLAYTMYYALSYHDRRAIKGVFNAPRRLGWPDGPGRTNYSASNERLFFTKLVCAYLGTNTGKDPDTGLQRNNKAQWVNAAEPGLRHLMKRLFGTDPQINVPINPLKETWQEERFYLGYRDFWKLSKSAEGHPTAAATDGNGRVNVNVQLGFHPPVRLPDGRPEEGATYPGADTANAGERPGSSVVHPGPEAPLAAAVDEDEGARATLEARFGLVDDSSRSALDEAGLDESDLREPQEQQDLQHGRFIGADTLGVKTSEPAPGGKHVRWADEEDEKALDDLLRDRETRVGDFNDSVVGIWLPGAPEGGPAPDDPRTIETLAGILPPQTVFVMADIRDGQVMHGDRPVPLERLAAVVAVLAPGRQPFLLTPGASSIAGPLADVTEGPVLTAPYGARLDLEAGTLTALGRGTPDVPPTGSVAEGPADRFRVFMPQEPDGEPPEPDGEPWVSVLTRTSASAMETPATTSKGKEKEKEPAAVQQDPPPGQDGTGPTTIDPMIRSILFPRTEVDLPYMPQLISALERELEAQGVIAENEKLTPLSDWLPDWVRNKYPYTMGHSDDQNTSGLMVPFGPAELLITLDPDEPYRVGDTADPAKGPEGKHDGTQLINATYATGAHAETHSGQTGQMKGALALTFSDVVAPGLLHAVKAGISISGVANQSTRSSTHIADAETGRVEDNRTKQILLSYKPNISFKVRTRRPGEQERPWREIKPTRIKDPGTERLNGWVPEHYLDKPAAHQVTATGEGVKHGKIPSHFYASGLENIPEMFDEDVNRLRAQGLVLEQGTRDQLLQKLGNLNAHLDKAVNRKRGYQFTLYDKYGKPVATIRHHSRIVATATRHVGATSAEAHLEDVRTAIEGSSGSHTLTHSSTVTPLNIEVDLLPSPVKNADLGLGINAYVSYTDSHSDSSSAGQTSLWVVVPRYGKNTAAYELHFEHWAMVSVRGATTHPSRKTTGTVKGGALVRLTEPQAFEHGFPVDREALKQLPAPGATTVPFRPDAVRNTGRGPEDPQTKPVAKNVYQGKGIGSLGWVAVPQETVDAIHSAIRDEVRSKGFLPADVLDPFDREHGYTHGNKVASRVDNQALLDKMVSRQGMGSHYDPIHQDGMPITLRLRRGVLGADLDVDSVKVTVRGRRTPGKPPRYLRTTDEYHTVQLPMGMNTAGQSSSHSRKLAIGIKFKFLFRFLKAALSGVEAQRIVGATDSVSHLNNRPELTETNEKVDEYELTSDYLIDFEYQHSGQTGKIAEGRRNPPRVYIRNQTAAAYLLPLGIVESLAPEQMSPAELKRSKQPTPSHVLDHGAGFYVDATGLRAAAEAMLRDLVGPAGAADKDVSAFTGTAAIRAYLKELLNREYTTDRPFDPGLFRDTFGALDISGTLGPSQFAGATASPYVLGLIYLFLLENRLTDNKAFGIAWEQLDLAFGGLAGSNIQRAGQPGYTGIAGISGEWDVYRRWQWNEALFNGQTGGKELLQLNFNRVYVFQAAADYLVRGRQEKHSKFFPSDTQRPEPMEVKDRTVLYVLGEPDALLQYAEGNVPVSDAQLKDAMTRWRGGDLRLNGDTMAGLLTRWRIDLDGRPKPVTADVADLQAFVDRLGQDMVQVHDLGGARIRNAPVRRDFGTAFGLELAEPLNPDRDISMPDDLVGYTEGGPALSDERLAEAMTAWNAGELALTGDVAAGILLRWKAEVPDLPGFDRDELVTTLSRRHTQEASPIRDDDVRGRFNETFERKLPLPPVPEDEIELPEHHTREDAGGRFLGHSGVQTFAHASGESTYQLVKKHVDKVARGMLTADAENWNSKGRVIGHLQGAINSLQGMLAKHRDLAMLEEFQAPEGYSFILPHSVGWLLSDDVKVTIRIPSTSTSTPVRIDHVPNTGIEVYHHGYTTGGQSNSRDGSQGFTFFKLATGGTETTTASDNINLKTSEGHHRGTTRADTIVKEQTTGDFGGHDLHESGYVMEIHVQRLDMSGRPLNNLLLKMFDRWTRHSATSGQTEPGTLELQIPDSIVRSRKERGPRPLPDLRPLPKLPGNGFVAGTTLDDARPIAHQMVYRMFKTPRVSRLLGTKVGGPNTRSSRSLPVLLSRLHLIGHLPETTDRGGYKMAGGLFDPGTSSERANVSLGGDLLDMEVLSRIEGAGVGRYSKHQSGTTVSASTDHTRATAEFSLIGSGPVGQPDGQPDTYALGTTHGRNTAFNDSVASTENKRDEGHGKEQNPLYQVKFRWQGRSSGVKFLHRLFRAPKRAGDYQSHPIHGEVYTHHYQDEIDDLRAGIAAAKAEIRPRLPQWPSMAQAPVFDLAPLLGGAAHDRLDPQRAYQGVARHIRTHGGGDRPIVLTADTKTLAAQTYAAVLPWAVRTMQADLAAARQIDPTVEPPRALRDYRFQLDARRIVGGAADSAESIAQATLEMINQVNAWHAERPGAPSDAPVALPREVAVLALDLANVGRDVASALQSHVRVDVTRSDGTVDQMWIGPDGDAYPFDPEQTRPDGSGALWVFDRTTSRSRYFSAAVAQRNGLLSPAQRAEADAYRLTYTDMGRLYLAAPARQQSFEQAFNAEIDARGGRLGAIDPALPGLLYRAADAHEFWQWEAERRHDHWNAEDPLGSDLALSEWAHQAQLNEESAEEALRLLQDTARGGPGSPAWTDHDVRSTTDRLSRLATAEGRDPGRSVTADEASGAEQLGAQDPELNLDGPPRADSKATTSRANEVEEAAERAMRVDSPARAAADLEQLTGELREQLGDPPAPTTPAPTTAAGPAPEDVRTAPSKHVRWADDEGGDLVDTVDSEHGGSEQGGSEHSGPEDGGVARPSEDPQVPWYAALGGLGDGSVASVSGLVNASVRRWANTMTRGLDTDIASKVRRQILDLLEEDDPKVWDKLLRHGKLIVVGDTRVKLSFAAEDLAYEPPGDEPADPGFQNYLSKYVDTSYEEGESEHVHRARTGALEALLFVAHGSLSHVSPSLKVTSESGYSSGRSIAMEVQSGTRVIANDMHVHRGRIRVRATLNRRPLPGLLLPGTARLSFPTIYSSGAEALTDPSTAGGEGGHPTLSVVAPTVLQGLDHAVNAMIPDELLTGFARVLEQLGLPEAAVDEIQQEVAEEYFNEQTLKGRSQWWLTDSWVSNVISEKVSRWSPDFNGHLEVSGAPHSVRYVTTTEQEVLLRNDIAATTLITDGGERSGGASVTPGIALGVEIGHHLATPSFDVPIMKSSREHGQSVALEGQAKYATMRKDRLVRYQTEYQMTVRINSNKGDIVYTELVTGELAMGRAHAKEFERYALGGRPTGSGLVEPEEFAAPADPARTAPELPAPRPRQRNGFMAWLTAASDGRTPSAPFAATGVRGAGDLVTLADGGPVEIVVPPSLHHQGVRHRLLTSQAWRPLFGHDNVTWVLLDDDGHSVVVHAENPVDAPWRYVLDDAAQVGGAIFMQKLETGVREPRGYVPNPSVPRPSEAAEIHDPYQALEQSLRDAGLQPIADFLEEGGLPQVQLSDVMGRRLDKSPAGAEADPLSRVIATLIATPEIDVVAADGRRLGAVDGEEQRAPVRPPEKRFVIDGDGGVRGPLRPWHHVVHPREPIALAARKGLGRGIVREMPGAEHIYREIDNALKHQMRSAGVAGRLSPDARQHLARVLTMKFAVPGGRGGSPALIDGGVSHEFTIGGYTFTAVLDTELRALRRDPVAENDVSLDLQHKGVTSLTSTQKKGWGLGGGFNIRFRIRLKAMFSLDLNVLKFGGDRAWLRKIIDATGVKEYRREKTFGPVTRFEYEAAHRLTVTTRTPDRGVIAAQVREMSGDQYSIAVLVSDAHLPKTPISADKILEFGDVTVVKGPLDADGLRRLAARPGSEDAPELDLNIKGLSGIRVGLTSTSVVSEQLADMIAASYGVSWVGEKADPFQQVLAKIVPSGRRYGVLERILRTGMQNFLEAQSRTMLRKRALVIPLPPTKGWRQEARIRLRAFNPVHEETIEGATLEQYTEADLRFGEEDGVVDTVEAEGGPAAVFRIGKAPGAEGGLTTSQKSTSQVTGGVTGGGSAARGRHTSDLGGALDLSLGTYSGDSEQAGADAVYVIEYRRWRRPSRLRRVPIPGRRRRPSRPFSYTTSRGVKINRGMELLAPYIRAADHGFPEPPGGRKDLPVKDGERYYLDPDLGMAVGYVERVSADGVLDAIEEILGEQTDPDVLNAVQAAFFEEAFRAEYGIARKGGVHQIFKTPARFWRDRTLWDYLKMPAQLGGTVNTGIRVTVVDESVDYTRPRPDVRVTTGGQGFVQTGKSRTRDRAGRIFGFAHGRWATAPKGFRPAFGGHGGYERSNALKVGSNRIQRDIRRAIATDSSQEFAHTGTFRVEVFRSYSSSELARRAWQVVKAPSELVEVISLGESRRLWHRMFPPGQTAPVTRDVAARAAVLVPTHLTTTTAPTVTPAKPGRTIISRTPAPPPSPLAKALAKDAHGLSMPGAEYLPARAAAAAIPWRRLDRQAIARGVAPIAPEFAPDTTDGLTVDLAFKERNLRANIFPLLLGTYPIGLLDGTHLTVQLVPTRARWLTRGGYTAFNFPEDAEEPERETEEGRRGWSGGFDFELGHPVGEPLVDGAERSLLDPGGSIDRGTKKVRVKANSTGDYVEYNRQYDGPFDYYLFDATWIITGPRGHSVTIPISNGFVGMLPVPRAEQLRAQHPELNLEGPPPESSTEEPADPRDLDPGLAEIVERASDAHRFWTDEADWLNGQDRPEPESIERAQANADEAARFLHDLRRTDDGADRRWDEAEIGAIDDRLEAMAQDERAVLTPRVGHASRLWSGAESIARLESDLAAAGPGAISLVTVDEPGMRYVAMNQDGRIAWTAYPSGRLAGAPAPETHVSSLDLSPDGTLRDPSPEFQASGPAAGYLRRLHSSLVSFIRDGAEEWLRAEQLRAQDPELNLDGLPRADTKATTSRANEVEEAAERAMRVEPQARAAADLEQLTGELREQLGDPPAPAPPAPNTVNAVLLSANDRRYGAPPSQRSGGRVAPVLRRSALLGARVRGMYRILHGNPDWASSAARYEAAAARAFGNREVIAAAGRIQARFHEWADAQAARKHLGEGPSGKVLAGHTADFGARMRLLLSELDGRAIGDTSFDAETRRELGGERLGYLLSDQPLELPVRLMLAYRELGLADGDWPLFLKALMAGLMTDVLPREADPARLSMFEVLWAAHVAGIGGDRLSRAFNHGSSGMYAWVHEELRPSDGIRDQELIDSLDLARLRNLYAAPAPPSAPRPAFGEPGYEELPAYESDASAAEAPPPYGPEDLALPDPRGRLEERLAPPVLPPYDGTAADCAVRLEALRRELYGGTAVARDDFTVGSTRPEDELAAATGGDWRPFGSTADIERQVDELGPGVTAFVLVLSPAGPGHAFALRNEDGVLLWVETQARLGERVRHVGEDPPAPVIDARVIVADATGRAVSPDALTQAMTMRDGLLLPSLDRVYRAQGQELEVGAYVVHGHSAACFRGEELLVRNRTTGVEVGTDGAELYLAGGRYFTTLRAARESRRGKVTTVAVNIIEITTLPEEVHRAEQGIRYDPAVVAAGVRDALRRLSGAVRLRNGAGGPGFRGTSVRDLFGDDPAYEFGRNADDLSVFRAVGFAATAYPQLTEGLPLATTPTFLLSAERYAEPTEIKRYLRAGLRFAGEMTRTYLDERVGRRVGRFAVPAMEYVPGVGDVRGAMTLLHTHAIAVTHVYVVDSEEMAKNEVLGALRTSFAGVRGSLRDDDAAFLERNRDRIRAMLEDAIRERLGRHIGAYERRRRAPGVRPRRLFQYPLANAEMTLGDYVDNMLLPPERVRVRVNQEDAMVVRVNYAEPDYTLDIDQILLEMRHLGADEQLLDTVERTFRQFADLARWAYYVAERAARNGTTVEGREYVAALIEAVSAVSAHRASRRGDIVADVRRFLDTAARRAPEAVSAPIFRGDVTTNVQADAVLALSEFIQYADRPAARRVRAAIEAIKHAVTEYRGPSLVRSRRGDLADLRRRADGVISALRRFAHHSHHSRHVYPSSEYVNRVASQAPGWIREDAAPQGPRWHDVRSAEGRSVGKAYYNDGDWGLRSPFYGELQNAEFLT